MSLFIKINKDFNPYNIPLKDQEEKDRKVRLDKVLKNFSDREIKSETIINFPSPIVDPSL